MQDIYTSIRDTYGLLFISLGNIIVTFIYYLNLACILNYLIGAFMSQVPPLFLDVHPNHYVLDSKQFMLI